TGARKVEHVRNLGKLSAEQQRAKADERAEAARNKAKAQSPEVVEGPSTPIDYHGVIIPETPANPGPSPVTAPATAQASAPRPSAPTPPTEHGQTALDAIPEPRPRATELSPANAEAGAGPKQPKRLPYDDAFYCVHHLHRKMTLETFIQGTRVWMDILRDQHPEEYKVLLAELEVR
ncbi:plasmid partitioning protein, partial [Streptomyces tendae]